jgi:hypothetical protein
MQEWCSYVFIVESFVVKKLNIYDQYGAWKTKIKIEC